MRDYEIDPQPDDPAEAAAIVAALERLADEEGWDAAPPAYRSAWRRTAAREAVDDGLR